MSVGNGLLEPTWFDNVKDEDGLISNKLKLPNHCPSTLILISENMVPGMFVAGGSCITIYDSLHQFTDIDLFCNSPDALLHTQQVLDMLGFKPMRGNEGALKEYEDGLSKAQIIYAQGLKSLENLLTTFDLSVCKIGFDHEKMMESKFTHDDILKKVLRCNPVSKNPGKLLYRLCKYSAKGYTVTPHLIQEIWLRNQQNPVIKVDSDNTEMSRLIQELVKQQQIQQQQIMQPLMPIAPNWPPLLPADPAIQELDPPYMSPAPVTIQPTTFKWTRTTTGTGPGDYQQPCSRCGSISHTSGSCY